MMMTIPLLQKSQNLTAWTDAGNFTTAANGTAEVIVPAAPVRQFFRSEPVADP